MEFNEVLKYLRKRDNLTQEELAQKLGISAAAIGLYEQKRRSPDNELLQKIAKLFRVSIDYLLGFDSTHYTQTNNIKKKDLQEMISSTELSDEQIDVLSNMIKSWQ